MEWECFSGGHGRNRGSVFVLHAGCGKLAWRSLTCLGKLHRFSTSCQLRLAMHRVVAAHMNAAEEESELEKGS